MINTEPKKTTSAGGVVLNAQDQVLVVNQQNRSWSLPKGKIEQNEDEITAARREIYEESGISQLELVKKLGVYDRHKIGKEGDEDINELKTIHLFLFRTSEQDLKPLDPHNPEARWVAQEDVADLLTHQKDKEFFRSILGEIE